MANEENKVRLDKWLWAARFYKTRSLASEAIKGGKVHVNSARAKPSKTVEIGQTVRVRKESIEQTVVIEGLSEKRGPAKVAQLLYRETEESLQARERSAEERRAFYMSQGAPVKRPSKKDRRQIIRFKEQNN